MIHQETSVGVAESASVRSVGIVVHSHLRWDFVWQRPQQLLSRIARQYPVLFVEEPIILDDLETSTLDVTTPLPNVYRAIPRLRASDAQNYDDAISVVRELVDAYRSDSATGGRFEQVIQWFYTPMPAPEMLDASGVVAVVYDCMDELAKFRHAPADLVRRERLLLSRADVVFTGGRRLFESKSRYHANVHFFGCGVDASHFGRAREAATMVPDDARIDGPVLGYFGVIDERLDYTLLRELAEAKPDCTLLMIGPVVKVDPRELPQAPNIRWLGQRDYAQLPAYVKAFDVCLMPFALNEATEYINPTKTLEYMAAGKPIVSTPVADVVRNFAQVVRVAPAGPHFIGAVTESLADTNTERVQRGLQRSARESWESIVLRMERLIASAVAERARDGEGDRALEILEPVDGGVTSTSQPPDTAADLS